MARDTRGTLLTNPPKRRPPAGWGLPAVNDVVFYRSDFDVDPIPVTVVEVGPLDDVNDGNCWDHHRDGPPTPKQDPNPNLLLREAGGFEFYTRQARHYRAPGWSFGRD